MSLEETSIEVSTDWLVSKAMEQFRVDYPLHSPSIASFDPASLMISGHPPNLDNQGRAGIEVERLYDHLRAGLNRCKTFEQRLGYLLRETAFVHETRHFHDLVCTPAGFQYFMSEWWVHNGALHELKGAKARGVSLSGRLVDSQDPSHRNAVDLLGSGLVYRMLFFADIPSQVISGAGGEYDVVCAECTDGVFAGSRIPMFPSNAMVDGKQTCVGIPFGFRAITECSAVMAQNMIIRDLGQEYVDAYHKQLRSEHQYLVANFLFTRASKRRGTSEPFRDTEFLFKSMQTALAQQIVFKPSGFLGEPFCRELASAVDNPEKHYQNSSQRYVEALSDFLPKSGVIAGADVTMDGFLFIVRDYALGCLRDSIQLIQKDAEKHAVDSQDWYSVLGAARLPNPPFSIQGSRLGTAYHLLEDDGLPSAKLLFALWLWVMLRRILSEALVGTTYTCPVQSAATRSMFQTHAGMPSRHCREGLAQKSCGSCNVGTDISGHPDCVWKNMLVECGVVRGTTRMGEVR